MGRRAAAHAAPAVQTFASARRQLGAADRTRAGSAGARSTPSTPTARSGTPLRTDTVSARSLSCWQPPATAPAMPRVPGRGPPAVTSAAARPAIPPLAP